VLVQDATSLGADGGIDRSTLAAPAEGIGSLATEGARRLCIAAGAEADERAVGDVRRMGVPAPIEAELAACIGTGIGSTHGGRPDTSSARTPS
jgi:hypothetical protein